jgi:hypothetical protein
MSLEHHPIVPRRPYCASGPVLAGNQTRVIRSIAMPTASGPASLAVNFSVSM